MLLRPFDLETTGEPPDAAVCEIGWCDVRVNDDRGASISEARSILINPERPMPPDARGVHHITDRELTTASPYSPTVIDALTKPELPRAFVAHKADFEAAFIKVVISGEPIPFICTYKVGLRLWPDSPNHKNQTLRYFLGLDDKYPGFSEHAMPPHRAGPDAWTTGHIMLEALKLATVDSMIRWSAEPALLPKCPLKAHRGKPWAEVPDDYLDWMVNKPNDLDAETKWNGQHEVDRRAAAARVSAEAARADYVAKATGTINAIESVEALRAWFKEEAARRHDLGIVDGTVDYKVIVDRCVSRTAELRPQEAQT